MLFGWILWEVFMNNEGVKNWKILRETNVGSWKRGFVVRDDEGNLGILVTIDRKNFGKFHPYGTFEESLAQQWNDNDTDKRYQNEAVQLKNLEAFKGLSHMNVARVLDAAKDEEGQPVFVLEFFTGEKITDALHAAPLLTFISHFKQVFEGLSFIHKLGLLHLNLKAKYTLTDLVAGTTKIMNIWHIHSQENIKRQYITASLNYAAPEVLLISKNTTVDERADLFSVGAMMYEAWCGTLPYERVGIGNAATLRANIETEKEKTCVFYPLERQFADCKKIPKELESLILMLLKRKPEDRGFKNAREVVNYILDTWPEAAKPPKELYGHIMTTIRL